MYTKNLFYIFTIILLTLSYQIRSHLTNLSYLYKYQIQKHQHTTQIQIEVNVKNHILKEAFKQADYIQALIKEKAENFCKKQKKNKNSCTYQILNINQQIQPFYQLLDNYITFSTFSVTNHFKVSIINSQKVAYFIDDIVQNIQEIKILLVGNKQQSDSQIFRNAIRLGYVEGQNLCAKMKGKLQTILQIQQVQEFEVYVQGEESQQEDFLQEEQNQNQEVQLREKKSFKQFNFKVECLLN